MSRGSDAPVIITIHDTHSTPVSQSVSHRLFGYYELSSAEAAASHCCVKIIISFRLVVGRLVDGTFAATDCVFIIDYYFIPAAYAYLHTTYLPINQPTSQRVRQPTYLWIIISVQCPPPTKAKTQRQRHKQSDTAIVAAAVA